MFGIIAENIGTIVVLFAILASASFAVYVLIRDKKRMSSCGGNCGHCPMGCSCGKDKTQ